MKRIIKNNIFGFILGGIIFGFIGVGAAEYIYSSEKISYGDSDVKNALDELYDYSNSHKTQKLGTISGNESLNVSSILDNYQSLDSSKFIYIVSKVTSVGGYNTAGSPENHNFAAKTFVFDLSLNYDNTTGIITITNGYTAINNGICAYMYANTTLTFDIYYVS